jgi:hypothetical protein
MFKPLFLLLLLLAVAIMSGESRQTVRAAGTVTVASATVVR